MIDIIMICTTWGTITLGDGKCLGLTVDDTGGQVVDRLASRSYRVNLPSGQPVTTQKESLHVTIIVRSYFLNHH